MKLRGKVAIVTGSSQGIGRGIAKRFAQEGASVVVNYSRSPEAAREAVAEVEAAGAPALMLKANLGDLGEVRKLVADTIAHFGGVDILVNNAGVEKHAAFWDVTEEDYDAVLDVNLKGAFFATQAVVRHLREAKKPGKIVNVSSVHEELPFPNFAAYCASKGGIKMLTRNLAIELAHLSINVNAVAPGAIETPINRALLNDPKKLGPLLEQIPLGRLGRPEDVAGVVAFLASPDADYVTGSTYFVDGGLTWNYAEQ
ncbi:MAG: glucose 1-dehydrogenase [Polyangiaceae bacterium]|jgi:glucose 1-dehydrogenase